MAAVVPPAGEDAHAPIWAPNPEVPLVARLLAYGFAVLMLIAIIATILTKTPPDLPTFPAAWDTYRLGDRYTLRYPKGWEPTHGSSDDNRMVTFIMSPSSDVRIEALARELPEVVDAAVLEQLNAKFENGFRERDEFSSFELRPGDGGWIDGKGRVFDFTVEDNDTPMTGGWMICVVDTHLICLVGYTPRAGWSTMQDIINQIAREAAFE